MGSTTRILAIGHSYVLALNRAIVRRIADEPGFEVTTAAPKFFHGDLRPLHLEPEPNGSRLRLRGITVRGSSFIHIFQYHHRELREILSQDQYDIVHCWEEPYIYAGYQIGRAVRRYSDAKLVYRTAQNLPKRYPPPFNFFKRRSMTNAHSWIAGGRLVYENMVRRGYDPEKGRVLPVSVDTDFFRPLADAEKAAVRAELDIVSAGPLIGFLGRLHEAKGVQVLLRAVEALPPDLDWSLLFLGSGPAEAQVLNWARQRGWQGRVIVKLVRHDEVPRYLGAVDILAAPSQTTAGWKEQFGRMVIEAFACGVPVIGSDSGEIPFVIGQAGIVLPEADPAAWAREIVELSRDRPRREELIRHGLVRAQQFSAKTLAKQYANFYKDLVMDTKKDVL